MTHLGNGSSFVHNVLKWAKVSIGNTWPQRDKKKADDMNETESLDLLK